MMANSTHFGKKAAVAALVALTLGAGVTMNSGAAEARFGRRGAAIAGVVGALAVGAMIAGAANAHGRRGYYADPGYGYAPQPEYVPQPQYYAQPSYQPTYYGGYGYETEPAYEYAPRRWRHHNRYPGYSETSMAYHGPVCKLKKQSVFDGYGWRVQKVQVCR